jgi:DNA-directed RNA polymerase subunit RPC12/RpoP
MPDHFINLSCANCGGKLEVYDTMDRFACAYCGTEMLVQRRGGTVALKVVAEAIQKVQKGVDKTAAELAIVRLEKERSELLQSEEKNDYSVGLLMLGLFFGVSGIAVAVNDKFWSGVLPIAIGITAIVFALRPGKAWTQRYNQIRQVEKKILEQKRIADS